MKSIKFILSLSIVANVALFMSLSANASKPINDAPTIGIHRALDRLPELNETENHHKAVNHLTKVNKNTCE